MNQNHEQAQNIEAYVAERQAWLLDAVEVVTGRRESDPLTVFPGPTQPRGDAPDPGFDATQEAGLREVAGRFGVGGEVDVLSGAGAEVVEGGKPWKVEAEATIAGSGALFYAGTPDRMIGEDEIAYMRGRLGDGQEVAATEYDMVEQVARLHPDFEPLEEKVILPFGYELTESHGLVQEATGQLVQIGTRNGQPVYHLRVDREDYVDEHGDPRFRHRPDSADLMGFVADVLSAGGDQTTSVGILTSNSYASRAIDAVRAGLAKNRQFSVGMYGQQTLADVRGEAVPALSINQIPGELHVMAVKLALLQQELDSQEQ